MKVLGVLVLFHCGWGDVDKWNNGWCGNGGNWVVGTLRGKKEVKIEIGRQ